MDKVNSICCPKKDFHKDRDKHLLFVDKDGVYAHCKHHGWMKIEFIRGGETLKFDNVAITTTEISRKKKFELEKLPVLNVGQHKG